MPLQQFTVQNRSLIVTVLKLPSLQLEDGSRLYTELERIESADSRYPGLNRVREVRQLLTEIQTLREEIKDIEDADLATIGGIDPFGLKSISVDGEYKVDFGNTDGKVGRLGSKEKLLEKKLDELKDYLDFPWDTDTFPVLWVG